MDKWTYRFYYKGQDTSIMVIGDRHEIDEQGTVTVYLSDEVVTEMSSRNRQAWHRIACEESPDP